MKKGFTLIEMLMAIALTVVIGLLVTMAFNNTQRASQGAISTLDFELQGRTIMDMIATDISNMVTSPAPAAPAGTTSLDFTTALPIQRTQNSSNVANGYYSHDINRVRWQYDTAANKLYRSCLTANTISTTPASSVAGTGLPANDDDYLIIKDDIRGFDITATASGTAYTVKFALTDAPISSYPASTTANITNKLNAEEEGYIWVNFERVIPVR